MKELFCGYCQCFKHAEGFKLRVDPRSSTPRRMCPACQEVRKKSREERDRIAAQAREARRQRASIAMKETIERGRKTNA